MKTYHVLARKWRPAQLSDVVGQTHIIRTLANATSGNRVSHAYLFSGSRGVGKTSVARIFAKLLRCAKIETRTTTSSPHGAEPFSCDACSDCLEIARGSSVDVLEIDGASNNGVEAIREIRENVKYLPSSGSRKIYIIDEVHMLTTAAFNALLKTLEEPPAHVLFIFATTEPHKIPATILGRCQRFDFRRVTEAQIAARLRTILEAEKIPTEPEALTVVAQAADGSMRDALSLLDQVIAFSSGTIRTEDVRTCAGLIQGATLSALANAIFERNAARALEIVQSCFEQGFDLRLLTEGLLGVLHAALVSVAKGDAAALSSGSLGTKRSIEEQELIFQIFHHGLDQISRTTQPRLVLDVLVIKAAKADLLVTAETVETVAAAARAPIAHPVAARTPERVVTPPPAPRPSAPLTPNASTGAKTWEAFAAFVKNERPLLGSLLEHGQAPTVASLKDGDVLSVRFPIQDRYKCDQLKTPHYKTELGRLAQRFFGHAVSVTPELSTEAPSESDTESVGARKQREKATEIQAIQTQIRSHPVIKEAESLFGVETGPVTLRSSASTPRP